jgi:hypothetical protein
MKVAALAGVATTRAEPTTAPNASWAAMRPGAKRRASCEKSNMCDSLSAAPLQQRLAQQTEARGKLTGHLKKFGRRLRGATSSIRSSREAGMNRVHRKSRAGPPSPIGRRTRPRGPPAVTRRLATAFGKEAKLCAAGFPLSREERCGHPNTYFGPSHQTGSFAAAAVLAASSDSCAAAPDASSPSPATRTNGEANLMPLAANAFFSME